MLFFILVPVDDLQISPGFGSHRVSKIPVTIKNLPDSRGGQVLGFCPAIR